MGPLVSEKKLQQMVKNVDSLSQPNIGQKLKNRYRRPQGYLQQLQTENLDRSHDQITDPQALRRRKKSTLKRRAPSNDLTAQKPPRGNKGGKNFLKLNMQLCQNNGERYLTSAGYV